MIDFYWYNELIKPALCPPSWLFPPVWSVLYITIFASLIVFIATKTWNKKWDGYLLFFIQLGLNFLWMPIFFVYKNIGTAFLVIVLLDVAVALTIKKFYKISKLSSWLLIPYFVWLLFATYLNAAFFILNH